MRKLLLLLMLVGTGAAAQQNKDAEICKTVFSQGIRNNFDILSETERYTYYRTQLCNAHYDSFGSYSSDAGKIGITIPVADDILGLTGSSDHKNSEFKQHYDSFCSDTQNQDEFRSRFHSHTSTVSSDLTRSFDHCIDAYKEVWMKEKGVFASITPESNMDEFLVQVTVRSDLPQKVRVTGIYPTQKVNCTSGGSPVTPQTTFPRFDFSLDCTKSASEEIQFSLDTSAGLAGPFRVPSSSSKLKDLSDQIEDLTRRIQAMQSETKPRISLISLPSGVGGGCQIIASFQMCWGIGRFTPAYNSSAGTNIVSDSFTFPVDFASEPAVAITEGGTVDGAPMVVNMQNATNKSVQFEGIHPAREPIRNPVIFTYVAIGKPK